MSDKTWLKRVSEQSWEPELLISGLAIYATLQLPDIFLKGLNYFRFNIQTGSSFLEEGLPEMIYSVFLAAAYLLTFTFILHFVVRAFWVGMIGLYSVYPDGINYDKLNFGDLYRRFLKSKIGVRDEMPEEVDKVASSLFSISFAVVFIMVAVGFIYSLLFFFFNVTKSLIPSDIFEIYSIVMLALMVIGFISFLGRIFYLNRESVRNDPETAKKFIRMNWKANKVILPGVFKSVTYIIYYFQTNVKDRKRNLIVAGIGVYYMLAIFFIILGEGGVNPLDSREFNRARSPAATMLSENYESEQPGDAYRLRASIEEPVTDRKLLTLFIPYHRQMDERFAASCEYEEPADSLSKGARRAALNRRNIACAETYFTFVLDETDTLSTELIFAYHPVTGQQGFRSFIPLPDSLREGRHTFRILTEALTERDKDLLESDRLQVFEEVIPFWYY